MNKKLTWEDILSNPICDANCCNLRNGQCIFDYEFRIRHCLSYSKSTIIQKLKQAEKDGNVCLNPPKEPESVFINHIKSHLKEGEVVICKICGKDVAEIYAEHLLSQND